MVEFKFIEYGTDFGTRDMGMKLREKLLPLIKENDKVVLDFTGVNVVSNSFADECIAKLLLDMPLSELKQHTTFRGLNPMAERSVLVALQRRYKVLKTSYDAWKLRCLETAGVSRLQRHRCNRCNRCFLRVFAYRARTYAVRERISFLSVTSVYLLLNNVQYSNV